MPRKTMENFASQKTAHSRPLFLPRKQSAFEAAVNRYQIYHAAPVFSTSYLAYK